MLAPFTFARTPLIYFGEGKISLLPQLMKKYGSSALLITGASSFTSGPAWQRLLQGLRDQQIGWHHYIIDKEPSPAMIDACTSTYRGQKIEVVVAIGGGSVLDAGKAISAMLPLNDSVKFYLEGVGSKAHPGTKVPFIALPTTAGTGSEATKNAVLSETGKQGFKKSLRHDNFVPEAAIVDPALTLHCPPAVTAASGMDAFTQLLESYLSTAANAVTDSLAFTGLTYVKNSLIPAWKNGETDLEARSGMAYASLISGITLANAGLGTVHGFASALGGYCDIPHGVICSALMGPVNRITVRKLREEKKNRGALRKYAEAGRIFEEKQNQSDDFYIDALLAVIEEWASLMSIPKLSSFGLSDPDADMIIKQTENKNNPVALNNSELKEALSAAM